jgi:hypothetical protein
MRMLFSTVLLALSAMFVGGCANDGTSYFGDGGSSYYQAYPGPQYYSYPSAAYPDGAAEPQYFDSHPDWDAARYREARESAIRESPAADERREVRGR